MLNSPDKEYPSDGAIARQRGQRGDREARGSGSLGKWVGKILAHLRGQEPHLDLPTDVQATAFQRRVWEELRKIPYGATKTYTDVARAIGRSSRRFAR